MSNGASLAPQEISMLFAVLPAACCQVFSNHGQKIFYLREEYLNDIAIKNHDPEIIY
jgi:hypothetical protein